VAGHEDVGLVPRDPALQAHEVKRGEVTALRSQTGPEVSRFVYNITTALRYMKVNKQYKYVNTRHDQKRETWKSQS